MRWSHGSRARHACASNAKAPSPGTPGGFATAASWPIARVRCRCGCVGTSICRSPPARRWPRGWRGWRPATWCRSSGCAAARRGSRILRVRWRHPGRMRRRWPTARRACRPRRRAGPSSARVEAPQPLDTHVGAMVLLRSRSGRCAGSGWVGGAVCSGSRRCTTRWGGWNDGLSAMTARGPAGCAAHGTGLGTPPRHSRLRAARRVLGRAALAVSIGARSGKVAMISRRSS